MKKIITDKLVEKIAQSLTEQEIDIMKSWNFSFVDEIKTKDFLCYLLKIEHELEDESFKYHLAMQKHGESAFNTEKQLRRKIDKTNPEEINKNPVSLFSQAKEIINKIVEWCNKYKVLNICSVNVQNTKKWLNNLLIMSRYMNVNFKIKHTEFFGGLPTIQISL